MIRNEQDTWNHIFHAEDKYTSEIIDQEGSGVTYGIIDTEVSDYIKSIVGD